MWRFVSAARMAQIKADARAEGYIKAVREGLAANDAAKDLRSVTSDNTHAANTAVQEMKQAMHEIDTKKKYRRYYARSCKATYADPNLRLIANGTTVEEYIFKNIGKMSMHDMAERIKSNHGTHIRGTLHPIKITNQTIGHIVHRRLVYDQGSNAFINVYSRNKPH